MPAHQTILSAKNALPYPLAPPYYVNRTDAWQARVMEAARSYFRPAEFADLQRLEIRFVPQEAERIKRHLRRRGDYAHEGNHPYGHPARNSENTARRDTDIDRTNAFRDVGAGDTTPLIGNTLWPDDSTIPVSQNVDPRTGQVNYDNAIIAPNAQLQPQPPNYPVPDFVPDAYDPAADDLPNGPRRRRGVGKFARPESLLRRTQLFIASIFVFDQAHALLRHLREECLSLTSAGTEADENLLKQIVRNVRGFTFRKLAELPVMIPEPNRPINAPGADVMPHIKFDVAAATRNRELDQNWVAGMLTPISRARAQGPNVINRWHVDPITVTTGAGANKMFCPVALRSYKNFKDFYEPFSQSDLDLLKKKGYIRREEAYWCPHRLPEWMARLIGADDSELYTVNGGPSQKFGRLRNQMVYPVTYLTNGQIADDTLAARLIEHCNARHIDPEYFSWGVRRYVFLPLEVDMFDITRFDDMELYDSLHETLNAFSTGIFEGMNLDDLWPVVRKKYQKLPRQVPRNMLSPFDNVCKKITLPASATGGGQRNFANEEVLRLFMAADDCLRIIGKWYQQAGFMNKIDFANYRQAAASEDTTIWEATMGNRPDIGRMGMNMYGADECGAGMKTLYYTADPDLYPTEAKLVTDPFQVDPLTGKTYRESRLVTRCVPLQDADVLIRQAGGDQVNTDMVIVGEPRGQNALYGE